MVSWDFSIIPTFSESIVIFKMRFFKVNLDVDVHLQALELVLYIVQHRLLWRTQDCASKNVRWAVLLW